MTAQDKFEYTRELERETKTLRNTIARLLDEVKSLKLDLEITKGECDAWKEKACDLQVITNAQRN